MTCLIKQRDKKRPSLLTYLYRRKSPAYLYDFPFAVPLSPFTPWTPWFNLWHYVSLVSFLSRKKDTPTFVSLYLSKRCNVFTLFMCLLWEINLLTSWHSPIRFWWQISQDARKYSNIVAGHTYRKYVYHLSFVYFFTWIRIKGKFKVREKLGRGKFLKRNITKLLPPLPNVHEDSSTWPPLSQPRPREKLPVSVLEIFLFLRQSGNSLRQSCSLIYIYIYIFLQGRSIFLYRYSLRSALSISWKITLLT